MAATGFHNKVERVFLVMHIGFVGVYSGNVKGGFLPQTGGFLRHLEGFWYIFGGFVVSAGGFSVQNKFFFCKSQGAFW